MNQPSLQLAFHGSMVLLFGLLLGAPYARAIKRQAPPPIVNSWRVAHLSLPLGATVMLAVAALLPLLGGPQAAQWTVAVALIVSSYAFCVSTPLAALTGHRGLGSGEPGWARLVYGGNLVGACASLVGAAALVYLSFVAMMRG